MNRTQDHPPLDSRRHRRQHNSCDAGGPRCICLVRQLSNRKGYPLKANRAAARTSRRQPFRMMSFQKVGEQRQQLEELRVLLKPKGSNSIQDSQLAR